MMNGVVKWFSGEKGYGFITQNGGGPDVFVHISQVERSGLKTLSQGDKVSYDTEMNRGKVHAVDIKIVA